ncbi:M20/M25/M40 family metallo-hydrolase [Candidatus Gracilibacteria bacterium]|nr:M20/M25/M40 family metallo-hydrolase [Candidatus Gracilibacteria bacterium]
MQHKNILTLLDTLLKIPSVSSDIPELERIISCVEGYFSSNTNAIIKRYNFNDKPSIVIQNFEGFEADIILNGHLDVVPPSEDGQFEPYEKDGKIFARGSGDMKSGVALMMVLMKEILEKNYQDKRVSLMITSDEELGGEDGVKKLVEFGYIARDCILIPDSGSVLEITIAEKGIVDIDVEITGKAAHSSRPWLGDNAIEKTMQLYRELKNTFEESDKLTLQNEYWGSTVELTMISGGVATNVIPDSVNAHFNIRLTETYEDTEQFLKSLESIITKYSGTITSIQQGGLVYTPEETQILQKYLGIARNITGLHAINFTREHGASDGRYFAEKGVPVILHRPDTENIHTAGEYVEKQAIFDIYDVYRAFIFDK